MRRLKKTLQDNLSLSSKLFLRGVFAASGKTLRRIATAPATLANRIRNASSGRFGIAPTKALQQKLYDPPMSALAAAASDSTVRLIAEKKSSVARAADKIQTSIIIPVFNKAEFTVHCLCSLLSEIDLSETEVIVVDNASSDDTAPALSYFADVVRVIRNTENLGFVDACNLGAAAARGKYLVFLNNDTIVLPGWLKYLIATIEANPQHGAVGSLFLYPDESIQEAGGIVWQNGEAHHYGWGASPDDRRFSFAREVDYCSAASLLIRKEIFEHLGGFDRRFAPAYYEDVDLCFGVRSLGFNVVYQPRSRLVHFEGMTAGSDTTQGLKQYQIINREKFVEKWRTTLEHEHLPKNLKQLAEASDRNRERPRVVVFDERVPSPDRDAGSLRMFLILKTLAAWCHVTFVPFNRPQSLDYERALWQEGIETADAIDYRRLLKHKHARAAIVSRPSMGAALIHRLRRANPKVGIVFDMVDTHFVRFQREYEISGDAAALAEAERYRQLERKLAQSSDVVWCASVEDKQVMEREASGTRIEVVPTIHKLNALRDRGRPFADRRDLLFIGNLAHRPNDDAVLFFMREGYPLVRKRLPDVRLDIVGDNPSAAIKAYNSADVRVLGYVPDVEPLLQNARVFIAPLRFGAGIKGKVGEAMAHGIPVVTTSVGAEGFGLTHGLDVMIGDDPASFAAATAALYSDEALWQRVADNSRKRIEQHFTPEVIAETINRSIKKLSPKSKVR